MAYDPNRNALIAETPGPSVHLPKVYVRLDSDDLAATLGSRPTEGP
jgi:hypothetical protein